MIHVYIYYCYELYFIVRDIYFSSPESKAQVSFSDQNWSVVVVVNFSHFHLLQNHRTNFNQTWRGFKFVQMKNHSILNKEIMGVFLS